MVEPGTGAILSAVSGVFAGTVKITEKVYEIIAVDEQSKSLITTINLVSDQLETARILRRRKSQLLSLNEKQMIERTFDATTTALENVAKLVEKTRVDGMINGGKLGIGSRITFVMRDSPNIMVNLTQLGIANTQLNTTVAMLSQRQRPQIILTPDGTGGFSGGTTTRVKSPPSYAESQMITAVRQRNLRKRASAMTVSTSAEENDVSINSLGISTAADRDHLTEPVTAVSTESDKLSVVSADVVEVHVPVLTDNSSDPRPYALGRARSRRWFELHSEPVINTEYEELSVTSADVVEVHLPVSMVDSSRSQPCTLGRARSRRWFELHYGGGRSED